MRISRIRKLHIIKYKWKNIVPLWRTGHLKMIKGMNMNLWAFEHTSCIYESAFGLISLHTSEQGAINAKERYIQNIKREHEIHRKEAEKCGYEYDFDPIAHTDSRIREITVEE